MAELIKAEYADFYANKTQVQLSAEINSQLHRMRQANKAPNIKYVAESRSPKLYYWDDSITGGNIQTDQKPEPRQNRRKPMRDIETENEHALYGKLEKYLLERHGVKAERISESVTNKPYRGKHKWRHPDLVGVEGMIGNKEWEFEIENLAKQFYVEKARLWSFEVKQAINEHNVRECYHQAISNSSWANLGYLCVGDITGGENTERELRILTDRHGIGIIVINKENPMESFIHIRARMNKEVDLGFCNELAKENDQFASFIKSSIGVYQTGKI